MITLKYEKRLPATFISHIDVLRNMVRIIRRTGYTIEFSQGFNPHMLLFFSPPLAVGVASACEYVTVDVNNVSPEEFLAAFNEVAPEGFTGVAANYTEKLPNLAGRIVASDYFVPEKNADYTAELAKFFENKPESYEITFVQKKDVVTKNVAQLVKGVRCVDGGVVLTLATGNDNLRIDRLLPALKKDFKFGAALAEVLKIKQYLNAGDELIDVDDFLAEESK